MTNRIFHVANLGIKEYLGDVHDYLENRKQETTGSIGQVSKPKKGQAEKADYNKRKEQGKTSANWSVQCSRLNRRSIHWRSLLQIWN